MVRGGLPVGGRIMSIVANMHVSQIAEVFGKNEMMTAGFVDGNCGQMGRIPLSLTFVNLPSICTLAAVLELRSQHLRMRVEQD